MIIKFFDFIAIFTVLLYAGCSQSDDPAIGNFGKRTFPVRGVVQEIRNEGRVLVIDHEEIPHYMRQMIMPFKLAETEPQTSLTPGDEITFTYEVEEVASRISKIQKTGLTKAVKLASIDEITDFNDVKIIAPGDLLPDYEFLDQDSQPVKLSDFRGMPVALSFVFSRCPVPEYCPAQMRNFNRVEEALKNHPAAPEKWKLLSISFDSWMDTPETMKAYGQAFGRDTDQWSLLSSDNCCTIHQISGNVGLKFAEKDGSYVHNLRTVILDCEGKISRIFTDETWKVEELVAEMIRLGKRDS
jgi:protein SCO1